MTVIAFLLVSAPSSEPRYSPARAAAAPATESPSAAISVVTADARITKAPLPYFMLTECSPTTQTVFCNVGKRGYERYLVLEFYHHEQPAKSLAHGVP